MANKISLKANDGSTVEFYDEIKAQGGVKDVYFSLDKSYVVAFYRKPINANDRERINNIVGIYRERIFDTPEGRIFSLGRPRWLNGMARQVLSCRSMIKSSFFQVGLLRERRKKESGLLQQN